MKKLPTIVFFLVLFSLFLAAYQLHLHEGWPRFAAFGVILLAGVGMYWASHRE